METRTTIQKINKTKSWFFEKINKIDKSLAKLTKRKKKTKINRIRDEEGAIKTNTNEIQRIIGEYFKNLCSKTGKSRRNDNFLDIYDHLN
jgi:hypothetical protein